MENPDGVRQEVEEEHLSPKIGDLPEGLVLVSSGSEAQDEEQEEGEIQDDDDDEEDEVAGRAGQQLDLEDISSEEESNIRERLAVLEAMDKEAGLIKKITSRSAYDLHADDAVYGKENYFYHYQQKHHHRNSNSHSHTHKSAKLSAAKKHDNRRNPPKRVRMVPSKRHLEKTKKNLEKAKRSSHKKHKRRKHAASNSPSPQRRVVSSDSEPETTVDREYLKIACATEKGRKNEKLHGSKNPLKDKLLTLSGKRRAERVQVDAPVIVDSSSSDPEDDVEEEEELQLRLLALSTKPIVKESGFSELICELQVPSPPPPPLIEALEENDLPMINMPFDPESYRSEERELRLIALKSAVMKKHETRLRRKEQDAERPYSPSDDIVLTPVHEVPPVYDELDNDLYSDEKASVEIVDDDNDVLIVEAPCELIALDDTDEEEEEVEEGGRDMEISSVESPEHVMADGQDNECWPNDMTEDSQQPIDMELASSEHSSEPFSESMHSELRPNSMLQVGVDSCDSELFTRRPTKPPQSPPMTPDSMEEAEAEALRHLLLTKLRQKKIQKTIHEPISEEPVTRDSEDTMDLLDNGEDMPAENAEHIVQPLPEPEESMMAYGMVTEQVGEQFPTEENQTIPRKSSQVASQTANPNLITLVDRSTVMRKRRKKSQSIKSSGVEPDNAPPSTASKVLAIATLPSAARPEPLKASMVRTQKLVNNPNKLINLNQTISPSPPLTRTDSPNQLTNVDTFVSRPVAKLVIRLGNSDSDSDVDFGSPSPAEGEAVSPAADTAVPTVRFEEQLDRFLKSVRSQTSVAPSNGVDNTKDYCDHSDNSSMPKVSTSSKQAQPKGPAKRSQFVATVGNTTDSCTAVKHLPKSAQMEYMRLMARMAQLERHKLARQSQITEPSAANTADSNSSTSSATKGTTEDSSEETMDSSSKASGREQLAAKSPGKRKRLQSEIPSTNAVADGDATPIIQDPMERKLQQIRTSIPNLSQSSRNRLLLTAEKQLEKHSGTLLLELEQHNATILSAQQERRELFQLDSRIELLREKLAILERARAQQRQRSVETFTSLQATHRKILTNRKRASELERMCNEIGHRIVGEEYQLPSSYSGPVLQEQLRILATETRQLRAIRKPTLDEFKEQMLANHRQKLMESNGGSLTEKDDCQKEATYHPEGEHEKTDEQEPPAVEQPPEERVASVASEVHATDQQDDEEKAEEDQEEFEEKDANSDETTSEVVSVNQAVEEPIVDSRIESPDSVEEHQTEPIEPSSMASDEQSAEDQIIDSFAHGTVEPNHKADREEMLPVEEVFHASDHALSLEQEVDKPAPDEGAEEPDAIPNEPIPFVKYTSPLLSLKQGVQHIPTGILCPYELGGQCVDRECKFEHFAQQ